MACADQNASAPTVSVGLYEAFCGKLDAPITNTLGTSQLCRYRFTTLVEGSVPITVPPVLCVVWYCVTLYGPLRGDAETCRPPIAFAISAALPVRNADIFKSF